MGIVPQAPQRTARVRRRWIVAGLLVLGLAAGWFAVQWHGAPMPAAPQLIAAIAQRCGPPPAPGLEAAARHWTRTCPRTPLRVGEWQFRLRLDAYDPLPTDADVRIVQLLDFTENENVETAWPNGSFYDWRVLARPATWVARLRAWVAR